MSLSIEAPPAPSLNGSQRRRLCFGDRMCAWLAQTTPDGTMVRLDRWTGELVWGAEKRSCSLFVNRSLYEQLILRGA
jgi:hypothetical protein